MTPTSPLTAAAAHSAGASIRAYFSLTEHRAPAISSDGGRMVWLSNASGFAQVWEADGQGGAVQLTRMDEPVGKLSFVPGSRDLILTTDRGGNERHQIWRLRDGDTVPEPLTDAPRVVHGFGAMSADGGLMAYAANDRDPAKMDVLVRDMASGTVRRVWQGQGFGEVLAVFRDGASLLVKTSEASSRQTLWRVRIDDGTATEVFPGDGPTQYRTIKLLKDGVTMLALCDRGRDRAALMWVSLESGAAEVLAAYEAADIDGFALSGDEATAALLVNRDGLHGITLLDIAQGTLTDLPAPHPGVLSVPVFHSASGALVFSAEGACDAPALWTQALDGSPATALAKTRPEGLPAFREPTIIRYTSFDGQQVPCFLYDPEGPAPEGGWPVMVIVHGGPELQWQPTFRADVQWMLAQGIRVAAPNVRGSTGYGRQWHEMDDLGNRMDSVKDLLALRDWLATQPEVDAARIGVFGRSYGGFMVLAAMVEAPEAWRMGVNFYGIANFSTMMQTTGPWRRDLRAAEYGDPEEMAEALEVFSPIHRIEKIAAPLLLVHAFEDPRVPIGESEMVHSCLTGLQRDVEYLRIAHEGHGFARTENRLTVHERLADFITRTL